MTRRIMLALALATGAPAADFLHVASGRIHHVDDADSASLQDFRAPASVAAGNVELDLDLVPIEAVRCGLVEVDGKRVRGEFVMLDLATDRGDDERPEFKWDPLELAIKPRRQKDLDAYRAMVATREATAAIEPVLEEEPR